MRIVISNILTSTDLKTIRQGLPAIRLVDGRTSAGHAARKVKNNRQAAPSDKSAQEIKELVLQRLKANEVFRAAVRPKMFGPLLISSYRDGMEYGSHLDDALMNGMRTDVAFTLFLNEPSDYDGGELIIESAAGEDAVKLDAGSLIAYEATTLHRVTAVTKGQRYAVVGWARSFLRSAAQRELLFDLETVRRTIFARDGNTAEFNLLSKSTNNLLRMWVDD